MKSGFTATLGVALALFLTSGVANASAVLTGGAHGTGSLLKLNWSNFSGADGEFGAFVSTNASSYSNAASTAGQVNGTEDFRTFCVQLNEYVYNSKEVLRVASISKSTQTTAPTKSLSAEAAWLYKNFSDLSGSGYSGNIGAASYASSVTDANLLQAAIWATMGWTAADINAISGFGGFGTAAYSSTNTGPGTISGAANKYVWAAKHAADLYQFNTPSRGGVSILNLVRDSDNAVRQDMIYYNPLDFVTSEVPEPTSLCLFGMGMFGAAVWKRRRSASGI